MLQNACCSLKNQHHSRAYIDFNRPEDVVEFAEFFDGHIFVNEKGNSLLKSYTCIEAVCLKLLWVMIMLSW